MTESSGEKELVGGKRGIAREKERNGGGRDHRVGGKGRPEGERIINCMRQRGNDEVIEMDGRWAIGLFKSLSPSSLTRSLIFDSLISKFRTNLSLEKPA